MDLIRPKKRSLCIHPGLQCFSDTVTKKKLFFIPYPTISNPSTFFCVTITIMASLARILHTIVSAPYSKDAQRFLLGANMPNSVPGAKRGKWNPLPWPLASASRSPGSIAAQAGTHRYRPTTASPAHEEGDTCGKSVSRGPVVRRAAEGAARHGPPSP